MNLTIYKKKYAMTYYIYKKVFINFAIFIKLF